MDAGDFLGLQATHDANRWVLPVETGVATAGRFLFGGCGLGAAIVAMERVLGRSVVWATAQYLDYAVIGEFVDIDVTVVTSGHHTSQARVVAHVGDREILTVNAALGERPGTDRQWGAPPAVPPPDECPLRARRVDMPGSLMQRLEIRLARGAQWDELAPDTLPDGRSALWVRMPDIEMSAASLAVLGDYVPYGFAQALGHWMRSNSLDNTLRIHRITDVEWVLLDIAVHGLHRGFGHGRVHLWDEEGVLLGTASQSAIVRDPIVP
ncbi:MAG TPA: thioesterase family protein [Microthrixaceae bacterium]|nr:thioesterase family protein [Microthrixaceae bacterium]